MNDLTELINTLVRVTFNKEEDNEFDIIGEVIDVNIEAFYFYEKSEPIYITVNIKPISELPLGITYGDITDIPLDRIRKAGNKYTNPPPSFR